jgi:CubicO group peptidase (beta-lactamase class C family)
LLDSPIRTAILEKTDYSVASGPAPETDEWMRRLGELPLSYQPGERWQYDLSNEVICVLVSRVTGQSFETFLRERILDPLGMKDTGYHVPAGKIDRLPPLYGLDPQTGEFLVWGRIGRGTGQPASGVPGMCVGLHRLRRQNQPAHRSSANSGRVFHSGFHASYQRFLDHSLSSDQRLISYRSESCSWHISLHIIAFPVKKTNQLLF